MTVPCVCLFTLYVDNLLINSLRNFVFYLDYLSAMFTLFEFFGILALVFVFVLFRVLLLNSTLTPTLINTTSRGGVFGGFVLSTTTQADNHHFFVLGTLKCFF